MAEYDNSGILFSNRKKTPDSKQPDYTGNITIANIKYELAGWQRQTKGGDMFLTMKIGKVMENKPKQDDYPF